MTDLLERRGFETDIYEPAEDSHLLARACAEECRPTDVVVDVGTGTGYVGHAIRDGTGADVVGVDINPVACDRAAETGIEVVRGDLVSAIGSGSVDVVVCNPPYLPTTPDTIPSDWLSVATAGGPTGRAVVEDLLIDVDRVLRPGGRVYLLVSSLMDIDAVTSLAETEGFDAVELDRDASFPFEVLAVLRLTRSNR